MLQFSCSHRPGVCITRPNCKARSDGGEGMGPSWLVDNEAFYLKSASAWWAGWATVTYGRVGKLKNRVGKREIFSALRAKFCPPWPETLPAPLQNDWHMHGYEKFDDIDKMLTSNRKFKNVFLLKDKNVKKPFLWTHAQRCVHVIFCRVRAWEQKRYGWGKKICKISSFFGPPCSFRRARNKLI